MTAVLAGDFTDSPVKMMNRFLKMEHLKILKFDFNISTKLTLYLFLALIPFCVYWQVSHHDFINFDDNLYVTENPQVKSGLTEDGLVWSFSFRNKEKLYWHPLTWVSHMLDVQMYGLNPGFHHLTNVIIHMVNTLLLLMVLHRMTGHIWRSALVAALFTLHPINVESVAWVAGRKNVLSTLFWMLTLLMYSYYTEKPRITRYIALTSVFVLGLLTKPMLVTLPFVLLLLDYWPLGRIVLDRPRRHQLAAALNLVLEKLPLLIFSGLSVYLSSASVQTLGDVISFQSVPMSLRISNATVSYIKYVIKMIWPHDLTVFYPLPKIIPMWQVIGAVIILLAITVFVFRSLKRRPYLAVGWLWYLGTLVPVIGLIQVGLWPAIADRWAYLPLIGLFILIAWWIPELTQTRLDKVCIKKGNVTLVLFILASLMVCSVIQIRYWKNSMTLFQHALRVNSENCVAHNNLGTALADIGRYAEAKAHFADALKINPKYDPAYHNLGVGLLREGKIDAAVSQFHVALQLNHDHAESHNNLGLALIRKGIAAEAVKHFQLAVKFKPQYTDARRNLNLAMSIHRKLNQAVSSMGEAIDFSVEDPNLDLRLKRLLKKKVNLDLVISQLNKTLSLQPGFTKIKNDDIPIVIETKKRYENALLLFVEASRLRPNSPEAYYHISCIYARQGRIPESIQCLDQAILNGFNRWDIIKTDSDLQNIRKYDKYQLLVGG